MPAKGAKKPVQASRGGGKKPAAPPAPASKPGRGAASPSGAGDRKAMANVRPLHDRVLLKRADEGEQKVGGIIVPDTAKEKPQQAEVVAVGSGRILDNGSRQPLAVKTGDKVLVGKWSGTEVTIAGEEYLIVKEDEILGILN